MSTHDEDREWERDRNLKARNSGVGLDDGAHPDDFTDIPVETVTEYLIWSEEHRGWWRANSQGYTTSMRQAGRYVREKAEAIVSSANFDKNFNEALVPLTAAMRQAIDLPGSGR